jgi:hypothetical protein
MARSNARVWAEVVDQLANALQVAIGLATQVRRGAQTTADEAGQLEASLERAVSALRRVQPAPPGRRSRK